MALTDINDVITSIRKKNRRDRLGGTGQGSSNQRNQGGQGSQQNAAGQGAALGGDPNRVSVQRDSNNNFAQDTTITRLGQGRSGVSFNDGRGGQGRLTVSNEAGERIANSQGTFSVTDFSGARSVNTGDVASLNAIRRGRAAGLDNTTILANARAARADADRNQLAESGSVLDSEIARVQQGRADGTISEATADARLNNLFIRKQGETNSNIAEDRNALTQAAQQSTIETRQQAATARDLATQQRQATSRIKTIGDERKAAIKVKSDFEKNALETGVDTTTDEAKKTLAARTLASQGSSVSRIRDSINRGGDAASIQKEANALIKRMEVQGIEVTIQDILDQIAVD